MAPHGKELSEDLKKRIVALHEDGQGYKKIYIYIYIYIYIKIYIYIYIVIHRQTVSFCQNSSVWLDTSDAWSRDRNPSNSTIDLVSDRSANKRTTLAKGIIRSLCSNSSSSVRLFTFLYPIGYQSAQFFRRASHYASGGRKFLRQSAQPPFPFLNRETLLLLNVQNIFFVK